ncbi:hypothetical protein C8F01DRAFT_1295746 [Mycena amicta]|nr:hypothetical protein C8F01DRAFT_1295746 [Mycena amicta]
MLELATELVDGILSHLDDAQLLPAALVSQEWLYLARNHLTLPVAFGERDNLQELLDNPHCTLLRTIRKLHLVHPQPDVVPPLRSYLPRFTVLSTLKICGMLLGDIPSLPAVHTLGLYFCIFNAQSDILMSLGNFPALRNLTLRRLRWFSGAVADTARPPLHLDFLEVEWHPEEPFDDILSILRPRRLLWPLTSEPGVDLTTMPKYLRSLGERLEGLILKTSNADLDKLGTLDVDLSNSTSLHALEIDFGLCYARNNQEPWSYLVGVSPFLRRLLLQVQSPLSDLTLGVALMDTIDGSTPQLGNERLSSVFASLDAPPLESVDRLRLVMHGTANAAVEASIRAALPLVLAKRAEFFHGDFFGLE